MWTVEGLEPLETAAGRFVVAQLSIVVPAFFGPADRALTWWGLPGEVRRAFHLTSEATDESGQVIGTMEFEETLELRGYTPGGGS